MNLQLRGWRRRRVATAAGRVHVLDAAGRGALPTTVLLHGLSAAGSHYGPLLERLRRRASRVLAPDLPAHGFSDTPSSVSVDAVFDGVRECLDRVLDGPAVLVGNSLGGAVAVRYALARPGRVLGLALLAPGGAPMSDAELGALKALFRVESHDDALRFVDRVIVRPGALRGLYAMGVRAGFRRASVRALIDGLRAMVGAPDVPAATLALLVGVPFDVGGARARRRDEAAWGEREAEANLAVAVNEARYAARRAWVELSLAESAVAVAEARRTTSEDILQRTRTRADARASTALDVALAERDAAEAAAEVTVALRARESARAVMREALDLGDGDALAVPVLDAPAPPDATLDAAVDGARARRAEPRALAAAERRLRASERRLRAESIAPFQLNAEVEWQGYSQASVGASAQWSLPVARTAQGERGEALAMARSAGVSRELAARAVTREAAAAWRTLRLAVDEVRALDDRVLPAATRAVELTEALAGSGAVEFFRVLGARQELAVARVRRIDALRDAWRARLDLDRATGADDVPTAPRSEP